MKKFFWNCVFSTIFTIPLYAQIAAIQGRIIDSDSAEPVAQVTIRIADNDIAITSDATGYFNTTSTSLPLGEQVLIVSKSGYITRRIRITIQQNKI